MTAESEANTGFRWTWLDVLVYMLACLVEDIELLDDGEDNRVDAVHKI